MSRAILQEVSTKNIYIKYTFILKLIMGQDGSQGSVSKNINKL